MGGYLLVEVYSKRKFGRFGGAGESTTICRLDVLLASSATPASTHNGAPFGLTEDSDFAFVVRKEQLLALLAIRKHSSSARDDSPSTFPLPELDATFRPQPTLLNPSCSSRRRTTSRLLALHHQVPQQQRFDLAAVRSLQRARKARDRVRLNIGSVLENA